MAAAVVRLMPPLSIGEWAAWNGIFLFICAPQPEYRYIRYIPLFNITATSHIAVPHLVMEMKHPRHDSGCMYTSFPMAVTANKWRTNEMQEVKIDTTVAGPIPYSLFSQDDITE